MGDKPLKSFEKKPLKVYIAGPMSGLPNFNYPAFKAAKAHLVDEGYDARTPTEHGIAELTGPYEMYFKLGLKVMLECEAIAVLPGWTASKGANAEVAIGMATGMQVFQYLEGRVKDPLVPILTAQLRRMVTWPW